MAKAKDEFDNDRNLAQEIAYARLVTELAEMQVWWNRDRRKPGVVPRDAAGIAAVAAGPRTKLTLNLDAELVKWFRAMGLGYQARMNYALRSWMVSVVTREIAAGEAGRR